MPRPATRRNSATHAGQRRAICSASSRVSNIDTPINSSHGVLAGTAPARLFAMGTEVLHTRLGTHVDVLSEGGVSPHLRESSARPLKSHSPPTVPWHDSADVDTLVPGGVE